MKSYLSSLSARARETAAKTPSAAANVFAVVVFWVPYLILVGAFRATRWIVLTAVPVTARWIVGTGLPAVGLFAAWCLLILFAVAENLSRGAASTDPLSALGRFGRWAGEVRYRIATSIRLRRIVPYAAAVVATVVGMLMVLVIISIN